MIVTMGPGPSGFGKPIRSKTRSTRLSDGVCVQILPVTGSPSHTTTTPRRGDSNSHPADRSDTSVAMEGTELGARRPIGELTVAVARIDPDVPGSEYTAGTPAKKTTMIPKIRSV